MAGRERKTYLELARIINPEQETNHKNWECTPSMTTDEHLTVQAIDLRNRLLTLPSLRSNKRLPNTIISLISGTASRNHKFRSPRTVKQLTSPQNPTPAWVSYFAQWPIHTTKNLRVPCNNHVAANTVARADFLPPQILKSPQFFHHTARVTKNKLLASQLNESDLGEYVLNKFHGNLQESGKN